MLRSAKILIFLKGIIKKILWESQLWDGRRKEPILGYVPKKLKKNSGSKGLKKIKIYKFV